MKWFLLLSLNLSLLFNAHAFDSSDPGLTEAKAAIFNIITHSEESDTDLIRMTTLWKERCGSKSQIQICMIEECDFSPRECKPDHVLLFRGEEKLYSLTTTSALLRARLSNSNYGQGFDLSELMNQFSNDLGVLREFDAAPQADSVLLSINSKTGQRQWSWLRTHEEVKPYGSVPHPILNAALTAYAFHVEASYLYYRDDVLHQNFAIDPLISFTSDPSVAQSFTRHEGAPERIRHKGRVVVLSVPKTALIPLCRKNALLIPGTILDPRSCPSGINEYTEEQELDAVLYPKPEWIYRSFITH
jgi:hypothetical protein